MMTKSPSGALSPYYYKGGYFHGIHYGSYFNDMDALHAMMKEEESFIMNSPERRRIAMDFYETNISKPMLEEIVQHIQCISPRIIKLSIVSDKKGLRHLRKALQKASVLGTGQLYFCTDMEEGKTWLVSDNS